MTLDTRKGRILQAIVDDYVETADPIGSEWLAAHYDFGCKSATLRNEMSEMSELGYLVQPHTSAGRIPSDRGYRYYVDRLMPAPSQEDAIAMPAMGRAPSEVDEIIQQTCRLLSGMTQYPSVATPPCAESARLRRVYLTQASPQHVLIVLLLSTGVVEHRVLDAGSIPAHRSLARIASYLNQLLADLELSDLSRHKLAVIPAELQTDIALLKKIHGRIVDSARAQAESRVFLEGTSHILRQREFQDVSRLEQLMSALEQRSLLFEVLSRALLGEEVTVIIGAEVPFDAMRECSVVTSTYRIGDRVGGFIGVVGPTRMHYSRAMGAVGLMARNLSGLLTRYSLG